MNKLSKDIFKSWDKWYETAVNISKIGKSNEVFVETIKLTSKTLINDVNSMDCEGSKEFKEIYCRMINTVVSQCEKQSIILGKETIPRKVFKNNIKNLKKQYKKGYK